MYLNLFVVERLYKLMDLLLKRYSFVSRLEFDNDILKLIVEYNYCDREKIDDIFKDIIYFVFKRNIISYCHECTGEEEKDICNLVVNFKF